MPTHHNSSKGILAIGTHNWNSNSPEVLNSESPQRLEAQRTLLSFEGSDSFVKTLGMEYNSNQDHFRFSTTELSIEESLITKYELLSDSAKIFDPLGLISYITIVAKIIFKRLWERGMTWDEPLPPRHSERVASEALNYLKSQTSAFNAVTRQSAVQLLSIN